jgi:formylglycine-generating enzyme required for sulfatase activity
VNLPPMVTSIPSQRAKANKPFRFRIMGSVPDIPANDLRYGIRGETPQGLQLNDQSGELSWDVSYRVSASDFKYTVTVADAAGLLASHDVELEVVPLLPLSVPFETNFDEIAVTATLGQKLAAEQNNQPVEFVNQLGARFRLIPPGGFRKDSPDARVPEPFYIGTTEVTQGQWCSLMEREVSLGRRVAVGHITSNEAEEFLPKA